MVGRRVLLGAYMRILGEDSLALIDFWSAEEDRKPDVRDMTGHYYSDLYCLANYADILDDMLYRLLGTQEVNDKRT